MENYIDALSHHGIQGMKWGIWNEETRSRYLGRGSSRSIQKSLNSLEKQSAKEKAQYMSKKISSENARNKSKRAKTDLKYKKAARYADKADRLLKESETHLKNSKAITSSQTKIMESAVLSGKDIAVKQKLIDGRSFSEKLISEGLAGIPSAALATAAIATGVGTYSIAPGIAAGLVSSEVFDYARAKKYYEKGKEFVGYFDGIPYNQTPKTIAGYKYKVRQSPNKTGTATFVIHV